MLLEVFILPAGALLGIACVLTGSRHLQALAVQLGESVIRLGKIPLTVSQLFLGITTFRFVLQCCYVAHCQSKLGRYRALQDAGSGLTTSEVEDKLKGNVWRAERNFWICLFSLTLWIVYVRSCQIVTTLRHKIDIAKLDVAKKRASATPDTTTSDRESRATSGGPVSADPASCGSMSTLSGESNMPVGTKTKTQSMAQATADSTRQRKGRKASAS